MSSLFSTNASVYLTKKFISVLHEWVHGYLGAKEDTLESLACALFTLVGKERKH